MSKNDAKYEKSNTSTYTGRPLQEYADTINTKKTMTVKMMGFKEGFTEFENVKVIRISGKNNLVIMCDYMPILGEVNGLLEFVTTDNFYHYENMRGYYTNANNVFAFLEDEETI